MSQTGYHKSKHGIENQGLGDAKAVYWNLRPSQIYELAVARGEAEIAGSGPLLVKTGAHTGRSAQDKFIVRDATTEDNIWWDNNKSMTSEQFDALHEDMLAHAHGTELLVQDLFAGGDTTHRLANSVVPEMACNSLVIHHPWINAPHAVRDNYNPAVVITS